MSTEQPAQDSSPSTPVERGDWPAPGTTVKRGNLTIRNMTGIPTHPANGKHRVVNSCRAGHEEVIAVHTETEWIAAMTAPCRVCGGMVSVKRHIGPDGCGIGIVMIPDPKTPPDSPGAAR